MFCFNGVNFFFIGYVKQPSLAYSFIAGKIKYVVNGKTSKGAVVIVTF